jgi:hypothetical protein
LQDARRSTLEHVAAETVVGDKQSADGCRKARMSNSLQACVLDPANFVRTVVEAAVAVDGIPLSVMTIAEHR